MCAITAAINRREFGRALVVNIPNQPCPLNAGSVTAMVVPSADVGDDVGFRFRRSFKLLPGVRLNLSSKSTSLSFGGRGFRYTVGTGGKRITVGIPGTGARWSQTLASSPKRSGTALPSYRPNPKNGASSGPSQPSQSHQISSTSLANPPSPLAKPLPAWLLWAVPAVILIGVLCFAASTVGH